MDSMVGIFYEETVSLINELRSTLENGKDCQTYNVEFIKKVFRVIHTIKADSTMMLIDNISVPSRLLENLLAFFRNNKLDVKDKERFDEILELYINYVSDNVDKLSRGEKLEQGYKDLEDNIKNYLETLKKEYKKDIKDTKINTVSTVAKDNSRQVYYIASAKEDSDKEKPKTQTINNLKNSNDAVVLVRQIDIDNICKSIKNYNDYIKSVEERFNNERCIEIDCKDLMTLKDIGNEILEEAERFTKSDFSAIAQKMEVIVNEMSKALDKPVNLIATGTSTLFEKSMREKISSALVHIIRNAVDHGIENKEVRKSIGKPPVGLIRLTFYKKNGHLVISVEDDGAGINKDEILKDAKENNLLKKPAEEYTKDDILDLLFASGISTTKTPNDYSGRGVGMDVIHSNVVSLGGNLKITSNFGYGTKIVMTF